MSGHRGEWIQATAVIVAALIGFAGAIIAAQIGLVPESLMPRATVTVTETITAPPSTPLPIDPAKDKNEGPSPSAIFLDDLSPIEGGLENQSVSWRDATFSRSLVNSLSGCSAQGPVDWVIPQGVSLFIAEIGVDTSSVEPDSKVTFSVYLDGDPTEPTTLSVGQHTSLNVPLGDHQRMRLESIIDKDRRNNCNTEALAVWGNARFER